MLRFCSRARARERARSAVTLASSAAKKASRIFTGCAASVLSHRRTALLRMIPRVSAVGASGADSGGSGADSGAGSADSGGAGSVGCRTGVT